MSTFEPPAETLADVVVVDYGLGNLRSVTRGLERAGASVEITDDPAAFAAADGVVLPGVGAFREGMENAGPLREALSDHAAAGRPLFGICLGMQMLLTTSEEADHEGEGEVTGLDLISGTNVRFDVDRKVPHMGWNELEVTRDHPIVDGVTEQDRRPRRQTDPKAGPSTGSTPTSSTRTTPPPTTPTRSLSPPTTASTSPPWSLTRRATCSARSSTRRRAVRRG